MVTADTITDEQIHELRVALFEESNGQMNEDTDATSQAMINVESFKVFMQAAAQFTRDRGRERCAEMLNARLDSQKTPG